MTGKSAPPPLSVVHDELLRIDSSLDMLGYQSQQGVATRQGHRKLAIDALERAMEALQVAIDEAKSQGLLKALKGLYSLLEEVMPDTYQQSDTRMKAAREAIAKADSST